MSNTELILIAIAGFVLLAVVFRVAIMVGAGGKKKGRVIPAVIQQVEPARPMETMVEGMRRRGLEQAQAILDSGLGEIEAERLIGDLAEVMRRRRPQAAAVPNQPAPAAG